jgi:hypothetical protein
VSQSEQATSLLKPLQDTAWQNKLAVLLLQWQITGSPASF